MHCVRPRWDIQLEVIEYLLYAGYPAGGTGNLGVSKLDWSSSRGRMYLAVKDRWKVDKDKIIFNGWQSSKKTINQHDGLKK